VVLKNALYAGNSAYSAFFYDKNTGKFAGILII